MTRVYSELYINDAKENLAYCFDYAVYDCNMDCDFFSQIFVMSGFAKQFEQGNPSVISGMSGIEMARKIMDFTFRDNMVYPEKQYSEERSDVFWAGWALAEYQWITGKSFKQIFERIPLSEIVTMYKTYHEMDISRFVEGMEERYLKPNKETRLKQIRSRRGLSQSELAKFSDVSLRSIQMYEQRNNDIDKAQAGTLFRLSKILGCSIEDVLENPDMINIKIRTQGDIS